MEIPWCMIGGLAVNHWAREPMATADVDVVIAAEQVDEAVKALQKSGFTAKKFEWSVNLKGRSKVLGANQHGGILPRISRRSVPADIHGILMRVASLEDTLRGKIAAWQDPERRASKRLKDLLDIMRLVELIPSCANCCRLIWQRKSKDNRHATRCFSEAGPILTWRTPSGS